MDRLRNTVVAIAGGACALSALTVALTWTALHQNAALIERVDSLERQLTQRAEVTSPAASGVAAPAPDAAVELKPDEVSQVRELIPVAQAFMKQIANPKRSEFKTDQLMSSLSEIKQNPERGLATLRALTEKIAAGDQQHQLLVETLRYAFTGKDFVDDATAERELRGYYRDVKQPFVQATAAGILALRGDDSLVRDFLPKIASARLESPDRNIRLRGVIEVAHTRNALATPVLVEMIKNDPEVIVKVRATEALGWTGGPLALSTLTALQESRDTHPSVRDTAARTLARVQAPGLGLP